MNELDERALAVAELLTAHASGLRVHHGSLEQVKRRARQRRQHRRAGIGALGVAASIGATAALLAHEPSATLAPIAGSTEPTSTQELGTSTAVTNSTNSVDPTTAPGTPNLAQGANGPDVVRVQNRLHALGFDPGPARGEFDAQTEQAVWAFEGVVLGRPWTAQSGRLDQGSLDALLDPELTIRPRRGGMGNHTEIYLDLQVLAVFHDDAPVLISHISSGSGAQWCESVTYDTDLTGQPIDPPINDNICGTSTTPGGVFAFYRRAEGNRRGPLGGMYNPVYFNYGIAVAGAHNVPRQPVSHGAIRIPMAIADYFPSLVDGGDPVLVWDGVAEPEQVPREHQVPPFPYPDPASSSANP